MKNKAHDLGGWSFSHTDRIFPDANFWISRSGRAGIEAVAERTAQSLIGGVFYFHKTQAKPSFLGGEIVGYHVQESGEWKGRIVFRFWQDASARGVKTGKEGWAMVIKICGD